MHIHFQYSVTNDDFITCQLLRVIGYHKIVAVFCDIGEEICRSRDLQLTHTYDSSLRF